MDPYPSWGDIEHQQMDIELVLPVSDALRLRVLLPALRQALVDGHPRTPEQREQHRETTAALERLIAQLHERLRPYGLPESVEAADGEE